MIRRIRAILTPTSSGLMILEASLAGLFFVQALRYLFGTLYSHIASASVVASLPPSLIPADMPGVVAPSLVSSEIIFLGAMLALPAFALLIGGMRWAFIPVVVLMAVGRTLINTGDLIMVQGAALTAGAGLLYIALLARQRATVLPIFFVMGFGLDQLIRATGNTYDPSWSAAWMAPQIVLAVIISVLALINALRPAQNADGLSAQRGILNIWSAIGIGALLYLQLALLALPNAIAARAEGDYTVLVPLTLAATLLPLIPWVRSQARSFIGLFDSSLRGWIWLVVLVLLLVLGTRLQRIPLGGLGEIPLGAAALVFAQFCASLLWWWFVRPRAERERSFGGLYLVLSGIILALLVGADIFTYEYAFVRDFASPLEGLNAFIPPVLRGLRGMGLGILMLSALLACLAMIQTNRRIAWTGTGNSFVSAMVVLILSGLGALAARPPVIAPAVGMSELRIGTYNIHGGYSEFYDYDLEGLVRTIAQSGADVVLLQEVDAGRLTSYGVDQTLWLGRRLGMDRRFYATNEGLQGLAVLSRVPVVFNDGFLLTSLDKQTGLQRVQIQPDDGVLTLYNTSLGLLLEGEDAAARERNQMQQMNEILATIEQHIRTDYGGQLGRAVLGGTFNNVPDSDLIRRLQNETGFRDPFAGSNVEITATLRRTGFPPARFDYIWLWSQSLEATGNNVIDSRASDHRMAVVGVRLRRGE